ncbi:MAG: HD domain-containing protein [Candidatus Nitrosotenuis sp.]
MTDFSKFNIALKYYLVGKQYHIALKALGFLKKYSTGFRKDNKTPEAQHAIEVALNVILLRDVRDEELTIVVALLHDLIEDYCSYEEISNEFGMVVADKVWILSKKEKITGAKKDLDEYFDGIAADYVCSIVKGCDRINNISTMMGVFTEQKQRDYIIETHQYFLPMLKVAANDHPLQMPAYMAIRRELKNQMVLISAILDAKN